MSDDGTLEPQYANPGTPPKLQARYGEAKELSVPKKSKEIYVKCNNRFMEYFREMAKQRAPSTLWSEYPKLKTTLKLHYGVNIDKYAELRMLLKSQWTDYELKKCAVLI
uniref:Uncharacterized protein n=1 Tax=Bracon brevicornis TaxID=1563983 RepID=A0A6V7JLJ9_9HYME